MAYDRSTSSRINRVTLQARHRSREKLSTSNFSNVKTAVTYTQYDLLSCTVQAIQGSDRDILPDSIRNLESYFIYTATLPTITREGTDILSDQVNIFAISVGDLAWFTVKQIYPRQVGVVPHYKLLVVKEVVEED